MHPTTAATDLRRRARHLRELAAAIEHLSVLRLDPHAGIDTWHGQRPNLCRSVLSSNQHQLHAAADDLRWTAVDFELQADRIDAASMVTASMMNTPLAGGQAG